ncbi:TIGR01777 family oxidoreductase [Angustibacter aerolatus]
MKIAVTGASGLIGSALVRHLQSDGHTVLRLVRRAPRASDEVRWDPSAGLVDLPALQGVEGVAHLAGAGVGDHRWTDSYKRTILASRVDGTTTLALALAQLDPQPAVLVCGSAVGFYGDTGETAVSEDGPPGTGFLADVVRAWEGAAQPARDAGITVAHARTGLVMSRTGGAFAQLLKLARLGAAGPLGSGQQWWSWITLEDEVRAIVHLLGGTLSGPVNLTAPEPRRQREVAAAIAHELHRPSVLPAPSVALRAVLGEFAGDVLSSQRVLPAALLADGFTFAQPQLEDGARWITAS